jgi:hypothetical protein
MQPTRTLKQPAHPTPRAPSTTLPTAGRLPIQASDLHGLLRLSVDGVLGITDLVEAMHHTIATRTAPLGRAPAGRTAGITGLVYRSVRGTTRLVGRSSDALLGWTARRAVPEGKRVPAREAVLAALNGIWGDHLHDSGNPLAIPMTLRADGRALDLVDDAAPLDAQLPDARGRVLVLVHGLCMNDLQWRRGAPGDGATHEHGAALARAHGCTPLHLHYNSGRHISENGRAFATLLERALSRWPVPVTQLAIIGHSMGGLVARSACHHAAVQGHGWLEALQALVFLGTPHHGAMLERGGHLVDTVFRCSPYVAPFARLGGSRSAGITDLRYGNLQDADWSERSPPDQRRDDRHPTPLPPGARVFAVAATLARDPDSRRGRTLGDGLVTPASALGDHRDAAHALALPASQRLVVPEASHWDLLDDPRVTAQLIDWLRPGPRRVGAGAAGLRLNPA